MTQVTEVVESKGHAMRRAYQELVARTDGFAGTSWGLWGDDDQIGAVNDITPDCVLAASREVVHGTVYPLNWSLEQPSPGLFGRTPATHVVRDDGFGMDDWIEGKFFLQASSQWDGLSHVRHPELGYYGGRTSDEVRGPGGKNGMGVLARRGIAGRFVLADVARWRAAQGRPLDPAAAEAVTVEDLSATLEAQRVQLRLGDILLVRTGWLEWYEAASEEARSGIEDATIGLAPTEEMAGWLWDQGLVAVGTDTPAVEKIPIEYDSGNALHITVLAALGILLGELLDLRRLAADCATDGQHTGLLTIAPLNLADAKGTVANTIALR